MSHAGWYLLNVQSLPNRHLVRLVRLVHLVHLVHLVTPVSLVPLVSLVPPVSLVRLVRLVVLEDLHERPLEVLLLHQFAYLLRLLNIVSCKSLPNSICF